MGFREATHNDWKLIVHIYIAVLVIQLRNVSANYCEFGICNENEYCCGENKCCHKTLEMWYLWAAILLIGIVTILIACILFSIRNRKKSSEKYTSYRVLANVDLDDAVMELP